MTPRLAHVGDAESATEAPTEGAPSANTIASPPTGRARKTWIPPSPLSLDTLPPLLTVEEVAGLTRKTVGAVYADVERGLLAGALPRRTGRGPLRFDRDVLLRSLFGRVPSPGGSRR